VCGVRGIACPSGVYCLRVRNVYKYKSEYNGPMGDGAGLSTFLTLHEHKKKIIIHGG